MNDSTKDQPRGFWGRLTAGLRRTSASLGGAIADLVTKRKLDAAMLEEIEELLIRSDLGVAPAARITKALGEGRYAEGISPEELKAVLAGDTQVRLRIPFPRAHPGAVECETEKLFAVTEFLLRAARTHNVRSMGSEDAG